MMLIPSRREAAARSAHPSRVHEMKKGEELGGPNAVGRPGDLILENDEIVIVLDQLGSQTGFAESGGNIVDAADAKTREDELGQILTYFGAFPRQGVYATLKNGIEPDGTAWVEARGKELYEHDLEVTTRYTLHPNDRALLIETTLVNKSDHPIENLALGDAIEWGATEKFAPGKAVGFHGKSSGPLLGAIGKRASYAITGIEGAIDAVSGARWSDTEQRKVPLLPASKSVEYARVFVVGERPDSACLLAELAKAAGGSVGELKIVLDGPSANAKAILAAGGADVMSVVPARDGSFVAEVLPGKYRVRYANGVGGRTGRGTSDVEIVAGRASVAELRTVRGGLFSATCREPCKLTIEGLSSTPSPDLGPPHALEGRNQIAMVKSARVALAAGRYRVSASRGPEYALDVRDVAIEEDKTVELSFAPSRVVDTKGYVAADFHQHTMLGADAAVATRDRVVANAAEGVEVAVASEHNVIADFAPLARELGVSDFLVQLPGDEVTTDASKKPWGHANVYPVPPDPTKRNGGAPVTRDRAPADIFADLRAMSPDAIVQINHPRHGITGYFDQMKFDPKTGIGTEGGYDAGFDALEVWNGRNIDRRERVLDDFFALLRTRHPTTAIGDTDTHGIVGFEAGYPRTYVRVSDDTNLGAWGEPTGARSLDLVHHLREHRDVVVTNGPFLRVTANGASVGGIAAAKAGAVEVQVHVECAPWVRVAELAIVRAKGRAPAAQAVEPKPRPSGALIADAVMRVEAKEDDAFVVVAKGTEPLAPVLAGDPKEIAPWAMTGAIWIDGDGDRKSLGR
jgi:hypothetical protein